MKLKGFIFDLDGTLMNTLPVCYIGFRSALLKYMGREYSDHEIAALFGPSEEGIFKKLLPNSWQDGVKDYLDEYQKGHDQTILFPGIVTALELLRKKEIRLAIVSGKGPRSMDISLQYAGLDQFFEVVITGSEYAANKPAHIHQVLKSWGYPPEEVAYIGDTAYDIEAAKEVGVFSIAAVWAETANTQQVSAQTPGIAFENVPSFIQWIQDTV